MISDRKRRRGPRLADHAADRGWERL